MEKVTQLGQKTAIAEAYRTIRANIGFSDVDNKVKTILFTSTKQDEGKTTLVSNIAYSFSKLENSKVLLIDMDLRNPSIHKQFEKSNTYGLMDHLKNDRPLDKCVSKIEENIDILTTGAIPPNPTEVLSSNKVATFLEDIKDHYDYIFIDSPPVGVVSDATVISKIVDGVMFIVGANETDLSHAEIAVENLKKADANVIGAVLNKYEMKETSYSYYGYYYKQDAAPGSRAARKKKKGLFGKLAGAR